MKAVWLFCCTTAKVLSIENQFLFSLYQNMASIKYLSGNPVNYSTYFSPLTRGDPRTIFKANKSYEISIRSTK